jgi:acylphosphatase
VVHRFVVHGLVQGVGFRWFVARHAERLGLAGWVRNRADGTVEVLISGDQGLAEFEQALARGPMGARVERVEKLEVASEHVPSNGFEVK